MKRSFWVNHENGFYFRVCGWGLAVDSNLRLGFSERYGYRKVWRLGRWAVQLLTPRGLPS